ncbi:MAG: hypothetical protein AB8F74_15200 [Saprospiraceae bacterium]
MMDHLKSITVFSLLCLLSISLSANNILTTDSTGLLGDHFSLEAALNLFKESNSPEDFEEKLNTEKYKVNNLDLNADGEIDYISIFDNTEGDLHAITLQVAVSKSENQDIAVIEIERNGQEAAILQIVGDENIYGETVIVEPFKEQASNVKKGPNADLNITRVIVNVWGWPSVRFVYRPQYRPWRSPWGWASYPRGWRTWRPVAYRFYYPRHARYRSFFRVTPTHRVVRAHRVYQPHRRTSRVVYTRTARVRTTRVATTRNGAKRKTTVVKSKRKNGNVVTRKKTVKKRRRGRN